MHQQAGIFWNIKPVSSHTNRPPMHRDSVITACNISQSLELKSQSAHMHRGRQGLREMRGERERREKQQERDEQRHACLTCMPSSHLCTHPLIAPLHSQSAVLPLQPKPMCTHSSTDTLVFVLTHNSCVSSHLHKHHNMHEHTCMQTHCCDSTDTPGQHLPAWE